MKRMFGICGEDGGGFMVLAKENETLEQFIEWYSNDGPQDWTFFVLFGANEGDPDRVVTSFIETDDESFFEDFGCKMVRCLTDDEWMTNDLAFEIEAPDSLDRIGNGVASGSITVIERS